MHRTVFVRFGKRASACAAALVVALWAHPAHADTVRSQQWYLDAMHADDMWRTSTGAGVTVAVIDSGVDAELPDLRGQVLPGKDFSGLEGDAHSDYEGHGTTMAVLVAGNGENQQGGGAMGLAPGAKVLPLRVISDKAPATRTLPGTAMSAAIRYAADSEAKILNISMGNPEENPQEAKALEYAISKGKLIFASVGNSGNRGNAVEYPAAYAGVIGVAAVDQDIKATDESQYGPQVDLAAPGDNVISTCKGGTGVCRSHGTSAATALASASAALVWSAHPDWTANQVLRVLINTAGGPKSGAKRSDSLGYGVVRPRLALQNPGDPGPPDVSPLPELAAATPAKPVASAPARPQAGGAKSSDDDRLLLIAGVAAAVAVAAGAAAILVWRRRNLPG
ncbi:type VII secretion-associated serine protease mycosin [Streptomyces triculaminicus]|uniref:type VII secretion-associated serine protease mycosin n=1 Tax=Streptomyces triculaminicus TaxID=2816232 RepID=UPI0033EAB5CB